MHLIHSSLIHNETFPISDLYFFTICRTQHLIFMINIADFCSAISRGFSLKLESKFKFHVKLANTREEKELFENLFMRYEIYSQKYNAAPKCVLVKCDIHFTLIL